jgi:hypothetical protein
VSTTETQVDLLDLLNEAREPLNLSTDELHSFNSFFIGYLSGAREETVADAWAESLKASIRYIEAGRGGQVSGR